MTYIELFGLPGAGKTTIINPVISKVYFARNLGRQL